MRSLDHRKRKLTFVLKSLGYKSRDRSKENTTKGSDWTPFYSPLGPPSLQRDSVLILDNQPGLLAAQLDGLCLLPCYVGDRLEEKVWLQGAESMSRGGLGGSLGKGLRLTEPPSETLLRDAGAQSRKGG